MTATTGTLGKRRGGSDTSKTQAIDVAPNLMKTLKKFGAFEVGACFSCGNCTAICPVSSEFTTFPRRMITYAQLGLERKLLESPDMWLCDYCGECSRTCPRQAEPAEFMMAARRFATSRYTPTPLSQWIYSSKAFTMFFMAVVALIPLGLIAALHGPPDPAPLNLFSFLPEVWIHYVGIALGVVVGLGVLVGLIREYRLISRGISLSMTEKRNPGQMESRSGGWTRELIATVFKESLVQYRSIKCETRTTLKSWFSGRWFNHLMIFWGFVGLLVSTVLRYVAFPTGGQAVPLTDPIRLLGTVSGVLLAYGTLALIVSRLRESEISTSHTLFTDWVFLLLLFLSGLTGFILEAFDYAGVPVWTDGALMVHLDVVFELLVMAPFTKFGHALYRPLAIWISRAHGYVEPV